VKFSQTKDHLDVPPNGSLTVLELPRVQGVTSTFFVRCQLKDASNNMLADNLYWQSATDDDSGATDKDDAFKLEQASWADFSELDHMPEVQVEIHGDSRAANGWNSTTVTVTNRSRVPAFFMRIEVIKGVDGDEILPITWDDNYITLFAGESKTLTARYRVADATGSKAFIKILGHNVPARVEELETK
jgi:exo-1,4-beta-D-glucosaminidase